MQFYINRLNNMKTNYLMYITKYYKLFLFVLSKNKNINLNFTKFYEKYWFLLKENNDLVGQDSIQFYTGVVSIIV